MSRKTLGLAATVIVALVVGFVGGHIWTHNAMAKAWSQSILVNSWIDPVAFLTGNSARGQLLAPVETTKILRESLEDFSAPLAHIYDNLPHRKKNLVTSSVKGAHNIAVSQRAKHHNMRNLSAFLDCLKMNRSTGASVRVCYTRHKQTSGSAVKKVPSPPQTSSGSTTQVPK